MEEHYYPFKRSGISLKYFNDNKQLMRWRDDSGTSQKYLYCSWEDACKVVEAILVKEGKISAVVVLFDDLASELHLKKQREKTTCVSRGECRPPGEPTERMR